MKKFMPFIAIILLLVCAQPLIAQFGLKLSPTIGVNYNIGNGKDIRNSGSGFGAVFGAQADLRFMPVIGIIAGLQFYDDRSWSHSQEFMSQGRPTVFDEDLKIAYFMIESLLKISIPNTGVYFIAGPAFGFNVQDSWKYTETVSGFPPQRFSGNIDNLNVRLEFKVGSGLEIPVTHSIDLVPQISFGYGITDMVENVSARIMSFQFTAGVKFRVI